MAIYMEDLRWGPATPYLSQRDDFRAPGRSNHQPLSLPRAVLMGVPGRSALIEAWMAILRAPRFTGASAGPWERCSDSRFNGP